MNQEFELLSAIQAAEHCGVKRSTIRSAVWRGNIVPDDYRWTKPPDQGNLLPYFSKPTLDDWRERMKAKKPVQKKALVVEDRPEGFYVVREAASLIHRSMSAISAARRSGRLKSSMKWQTSNGQMWLYAKADLEAWVNGHGEMQADPEYLQNMSEVDRARVERYIERNRKRNEARRLARREAAILRGQNGPVRIPGDDPDAYWIERERQEKEQHQRMLQSIRSGSMPGRCSRCRGSVLTVLEEELQWVHSCLSCGHNEEVMMRVPSPVVVAALGE